MEGKVEVHFTRAKKFQITKTEVSGFSVPRCRFASDGISASLQHVSASMFLFPDTRHLTPEFEIL